MAKKLSKAQSELLDVLRTLPTVDPMESRERYFISSTTSKYFEEGYIYGWFNSATLRCLEAKGYINVYEYGARSFDKLKLV